MGDYSFGVKGVGLFEELKELGGVKGVKDKWGETFTFWELKELEGVKGVKDKWGCSLDGVPWS